MSDERVKFFEIEWSDEDDAYVAIAPERGLMSGVGEHPASALAFLLEAITVADIVQQGEDGATR